MKKKDVEKLRRTQGCLTDCIAFFFNLHPQSVPYFVYPRQGWARRVRRYFKRRGYEVRWRMIRSIPKRGTHIVCGDSLRWKTAAHVVVYRNGKLAYDPQFPSLWKDKRVTHRLIVKKI